MQKKNGDTINKKKIAINTIIVYVRLFITTIIGLISTRLVLRILGVADYGLYNVVGGIIVVLNVFCVAMHTTTRRFINVEMGKLDGNVNKVFNICMKLHIRIAVIFFLLAELIGLLYIYNYLNVEECRLSDCVFIYNISLITSCLGLINVPYQSTLVARERFIDIALIDIITKIILFGMIILLYIRGGYALRLYAISMCVSVLLSLILYTLGCYRRYSSDVCLKRYVDKDLTKEMLRFNAYTTIGASSYMIRAQGANIIINLFFNTIVNGAYAIAYQIESYLILFISNLTTASAPQITKSYANGDIDASMNLVMRMNRLCILVMMFICFAAIVELPFLLKLWLGVVPEYAVLFVSLTIISAFIRSLGEGIPPLVQASGRIKWFQIFGSIFTFLDIPFVIIFFVLGFPPQTMIIVFCVSSICGRIVNIYLLYRILKYDVLLFLRVSYFPIIKILPFLVAYYVLYSRFELTTNLSHVIGLLSSVILAGIIIFFLGFDEKERLSIFNTLKTKLKTR